MVIAILQIFAAFSYSEVDRLDVMVREASIEYDVPMEIIKAVIKQESNGRRYAVSPVGAGGMMQLMPKTAKFLGVKNRFDPKQNIQGGAKYLALLYKRTGNWLMAFASYNAGPSRAQSNKKLPRETIDYVARVTKHWLNLDTRNQRVGECLLTDLGNERAGWRWAGQTPKVDMGATKHGNAPLGVQDIAEDRKSFVLPSVRRWQSA